MDYSEYDRIQADLGAIADSFENDYRRMISLSNVDTETKELITNICKSIETHFHETAILISRTARLMTK